MSSKHRRSRVPFVECPCMQEVFLSCQCNKLAQPRAIGFLELELSAWPPVT